MRDPAHHKLQEEVARRELISVNPNQRHAIGGRQVNVGVSLRRLGDVEISARLVGSQVENIVVSRCLPEIVDDIDPGTRSEDEDVVPTSTPQVVIAGASHQSIISADGRDNASTYR